MPGAVVAWDSESATVGGTGAVTVSVAVEVLVFMPAPALSAPGAMLAVYMPGVGLCTVSTMVQLPEPGILPIPNEYTPPPTLPKVPQVFVPGGVAVRPAGMVILPPLMKAGVAEGLVSVNVMLALVATGTLVGANVTAIVGVAAATPDPLSPILVGLVAALELMMMVAVSGPVALGVKIMFSTQDPPGAILIGEPVLGAPPAFEPKPHQ